MWLLKEETAQAMADARKAGLCPSDEQASAFAASVAAARDGGKPRSLAVAGDVAEIRVEGVLTKEPDLWAMWFGGGNTSYKDVIAAIAVAESDPSVSRIVLHVDSPGGSVDGLFDAIAALQSVKKPMTARVSEACSAAYAIASQAGRIEAVNPASCVGSIGVVAQFMVYEDVVTITSTEAPDKRPDVTTAEGQATVRKYLDAIHGLFVEAIASGRKTTTEKVNATYGRGAVLLANDAKKLGMIDGIAGTLRVVGGTKANAEPEVESAEQGQSKPRRNAAMNLKELRAQHPELCEELEQNAAKAALDSERDRVGAHLTMGEKSGDMKTALAAIRDGSGMTQTLLAQYMTAGMNKSDRLARQSESDQAGAAVDGAPSASENTADIGDIVAERMAKKRGLTNG